MNDKKETLIPYSGGKNSFSNNNNKMSESFNQFVDTLGGGYDSFTPQNLKKEIDKK